MSTNTTKNKTSLKNSTPKGYTRIETLIAASLISLFLGYLLGNLLPNINRMPGQGGQNIQPVASAGQNPNSSAQAEKMIQSLLEESQLAPQNPEVWTKLGNLYFDTDQYQKAIKAYQRSLELSPDNTDVLTDLGIMYRRSGLPQKALTAFDQAMATDPSHQMSRYNKGVVLLHDFGNQQEALAVWEQLLTLNPQFMTPAGQPLKDLVKELK